ncbi:hypothetical protein G7066_14450 [Leucobacter coleopterorum]|uniref:Uncharacterized protein n=1 Tax=Leucobacter coleopterorum TaxID=2714933 RepID=A0ABX6JZ08_9MICO|nr:hypothetical protein [Leucobacter coleopterorum]QIM19472.1 hypothetical protein G7066_14450 [Leucobacter coleopterorum]
MTVPVAVTEREVVRLTQPHTEMTEAGAVEWPPLLVWLDNSITEVVKRGGAGSNGTGIPINFGALHLLDGIRRACGRVRETLFLSKQSGKDALLGDVVEMWAVARQARSRGEVADEQWLSVCEEIGVWVARIEAEQGARSRQMELTVPCPRCGVRWVLDGGERRAAVVIEYAEGRAPVAGCRAEECEALWVGWDQIAKLGFSVQASVDIAVLADCGIRVEDAAGPARDAGGEFLC